MNSSPKARFLISGGPIHTPDSTPRTVDWLLVAAGRVEAVGMGSPPEMEVGTHLDLRGRHLVPGFCDAHVHLTWIATASKSCDLASSADLEAALATLSGYEGVGRGPEGEWLVGFGFDESLWPDPRLPSRVQLDAIDHRRPILLQRVCGHVGVVNSAALARITPGPHTNVETGRIAEDDLYSVNDLLRPTIEDLEHALPAVESTLFSHGITAVHDVASPEMLTALQRNGAVWGVHTSCSVPARYLGAAALTGARTPGEFFAAAGLTALPANVDDGWPRMMGVKLFLDGSLGARTAYLREPYTDAPTTRGAPLYETQALEYLVRAVDRAGLQLMVHAIGDAALDQGLDVLEPLVRNGNPLRHRLEHVEVTPADLVDRLARSGVWCCVQPNFAGRWSIPGGLNSQRLGPRLQHCNAYRSLAAQGIPLAFGSDCMPLGPFEGLLGAVQHPIEVLRLELEAALGMYTTQAVRLVGREDDFGSLTPGQEADFVVLGPALGTRPVGPWAPVVATYRAGTQVWPAPPEVPEAL